MKEDYSKAMRVILTYEGGKDDDPVDPGGRTNQGIIQRVYTAWRMKKGLPNRDVFLMEDSERDEIYRQNYANQVRFDELPPGVDVVMLDGAVNSGPSQSIKWAQRALGLYADGVLGPVTMQRIENHPDHDELIDAILERRRLFLKALKTYYRFGKGWMARVNNLEKIGQAWAMGSVGPPVEYSPLGHKKATIVDAKAPPSTAPADFTAAGGGMSTALTTVQSVFEPMQGTAVADKVLLALAVVGGLAAAFGIAYGLYARKKRDEYNDVLDLVASHASTNNDDIPQEVLSNYNNYDAQGSATGNFVDKRKNQMRLDVEKELAA
jgi:lysozyme family protein